MGHEPHREQRATRREECLTELMRGRNKTAGPMKTKAAQKHPYFLQAAGTRMRRWIVIQGGKAPSRPSRYVLTCSRATKYKFSCTDMQDKDEMYIRRPTK